jgi:hypothetical protein
MRWQRGWLGRHGGGEGMTLTSGAHLSVREKRQGAKAKYTNPKGKHIRDNTPTRRRPTVRDGLARRGLDRSGQISREDFQQ